MIPSAGPWITDKEVELVAEATRNGWYEHRNRYVEEFERQFSLYSGMRYCLATNTCTAAIHLAMLGLGLGRGDEVIVPDITWVASAAPACYVGATPVFADIDRQNWCLSADAFERAITRRTKAVVVVGLLGNLPNMDELMAVAERHRIPIIEDAAESIGAEYKGRKAGTFGAVGVYSFNGTKLLVMGEGGMVVTNNKMLFRRCKRLSHHGLSDEPGGKLYWSEEIGYKYKVSNIQAALGLAQLNRIDALISKRRTIFSWYSQRLGEIDGIELNPEGPHVKSTFWIVTAIIHPRYGVRKERLMRELAKYQIAARPFFYPLSSMPAFSSYCRGHAMQKRNPVAYEMSPYGICLPSAFSLTEHDVDYVCDVLRDILVRKATRRGARVMPRR